MIDWQHLYFGKDKILCNSYLGIRNRTRLRPGLPRSLLLTYILSWPILSLCLLNGSLLSIPSITHVHMNFLGSLRNTDQIMLANTPTTEQRAQVERTRLFRKLGGKCFSSFLFLPSMTAHLESCGWSSLQDISASVSSMCGHVWAPEVCISESVQALQHELGKAAKY